MAAGDTCCVGGPPTVRSQSAGETTPVWSKCACRIMAGAPASTAGSVSQPAHNWSQGILTSLSSLRRINQSSGSQLSAGVLWRGVGGLDGRWRRAPPLPKVAPVGSDVPPPSEEWRADAFGGGGLDLGPRWVEGVHIVAARPPKVAREVAIGRAAAATVAPGRHLPSEGVLGARAMRRGVRVHPACGGAVVHRIHAPPVGALRKQEVGVLCARLVICLGVAVRDKIVWVGGAVLVQPEQRGRLPVFTVPAVRAR
eukprot:scaffold22815_cov60-Phaeocystis_antarctica.AAC.7